MLVLSRKRDEGIMIGNDVEVVVVDVRGDKVRLGVRAPTCVSVHRREVFNHVRSASVPTSPTQSSSHDLFMQAAMDEAQKGAAEGGLPIGSVLVRGNEIIGRGHDRRVQDGDPMAHAEIDCLSNAGRQATYKDTVLYSTLMPCYLCSGAVVQVGVPTVVVGGSVAADSTGRDGSAMFMKSHGIDLIDLHHRECIELMRAFIETHPEQLNHDLVAN